MENIDFRPLRKTKLELNMEETKENLKSAEYGVLAVLGDHGYPHAVPLNYVYMDGKIYFLHQVKVKINLSSRLLIYQK